MTLTQQVLSGDRLALARLLTQVENDSPEGRAALTELFPYTGRAHLIGVTGAPGTGKSSLVNQLVLHYRKSQNKRVAIVAVDPTSPFTGGAVLGDRVRMRDLSGDPDVFIRSMASRGSLGGLAYATATLTQVFDAAGYEVIFIETVGAGQSEVDVARLAHTTIVVEAPGLGDDIQAIKAGILEIADLIVINKADRPGVENTEKALGSMLSHAHSSQKVFRHHGQYVPIASNLSLDDNEDDSSPADDTVNWILPILRTISTEGTGIDRVVDAIGRHAAYLRQSGNWTARERARFESELEALIERSLLVRFHANVPSSTYDEIVDQVLSRKLSPEEAVTRLIDGKPS